MPSNLQDEISAYIRYFRSEHEKLLRIEERLHRKFLVVTMLSSLAEGRYPNVRGDQDKFVKLIETYSKWPDATSISVFQLEMQIKKLKDGPPSGLSRNFVEDISCRYADLHSPDRQGRILGLDIDPTLKDLLQKYLNKEDKKLVKGTKHSFLLYRYRCKLVHEYREPGHGFEFDQRRPSPYYHSSMNPYDQSATIELVYPTQWFLELPQTILAGLETHYINAGTNPYDSYKFGSPWG